MENSFLASGRAGSAAFENDVRKVKSLLARYGISPRLTFSNSLLQKEHLTDKKCNALCALFSENLDSRDPNDEVKDETKDGHSVPTGIIVHSDLLLDYLKSRFPQFYFVSSTTKVLTDFSDFKSEINHACFSFVVPDFRLNKDFSRLALLTQEQKDKTEFLCNECCDFSCTARSACYQSVSREILESCCDFADSDLPNTDCTNSISATGATHLICRAPGGSRGYKFSLAQKNPAFISLSDIQNTYLPMGFSNFKIEGRSLGSALLLEFLLYYMTKTEYHIHVREELYLNNTLDLF